MDETLKIISNTDKICIYMMNRTIKSSSNARYLYDLLYNSYFSDKDYDREIISDNSEYRTRAYGGHLRKYLYLLSSTEPSSISMADADLLISVNGEYFQITKSRYTPAYGYTMKIKDLPIYQRKDKINKIMKRNEERITT